MWKDENKLPPEKKNARDSRRKPKLGEKYLTEETRV
jgi:hypothetical protein